MTPVSPPPPGGVLGRAPLMTAAAPDLDHPAAADRAGGFAARRALALRGRRRAGARRAARVGLAATGRGRSDGSPTTRSGFMQQGAASTFGDKGFSVLILPADGDLILVLDQRVRPGEVAIEDARTGPTITPAVAGGAAGETGLVGKRLGIVGEGRCSTASAARSRRARQRRWTSSPPTAGSSRCAQIKSPAEQELLRYAFARVGSAWMTAMMEAIAPGRTEADLVAAGLPIMLAAGGWPMDVVARLRQPRARPQAERGIRRSTARRPVRGAATSSASTASAPSRAATTATWPARPASAPSNRPTSSARCWSRRSS